MIVGCPIESSEIILLIVRLSCSFKKEAAPSW